MRERPQQTSAPIRTSDGIFYCVSCCNRRLSSFLCRIGRFHWHHWYFDRQYHQSCQERKIACRRVCYLTYECIVRVRLLTRRGCPQATRPFSNLGRAFFFPYRKSGTLRNRSNCWTRFNEIKKQFLTVRSLIDSGAVFKVIALLSGHPANLTRALWGLDNVDLMAS